MFRDEQAELPFRQRAEQLRVSMQDGPKVDRRLSIDQVPETAEPMPATSNDACWRNWRRPVPVSWSWLLAVAI